MTQMRYWTEQGWGTTNIGVAIENPRPYVDGAHVYYDDGGFLTYDGGMTFDPVNQYFLLNPFREHAARFAHQLDAAMGHHSLSSASEERTG